MVTPRHHIWGDGGHNYDLYRGCYDVTDCREYYGNTVMDTTVKAFCDGINYAMLSIEDPKKYPRPMGESLPYASTVTPESQTLSVFE